MFHWFLGTLTQCRVSYGRYYDWQQTSPSFYTGFDYLAKWIGEPQGAQCAGQPSCTNVVDDGPLARMIQIARQNRQQVVLMSYMIKFEANNMNGWRLVDCNDPDRSKPNLCQRGAEFIRQNTPRILERYEHNASKYTFYES